MSAHKLEKERPVQSLTSFDYSKYLESEWLDMGKKEAHIEEYYAKGIDYVREIIQIELLFQLTTVVCNRTTRQ